MSEEITALSLAYGLNDVYTKFTDAVKALGNKHTGKGKFSENKVGQSVLHWLVGNHMRTERDILCEQFLNDVQAHLELFSAALEGIDRTEAEEACAVVTDILSTPVAAGSNSTTDLMKRAMIGQSKPFISKLSHEDLVKLKEKIEKSYKKFQRLPVEKDVLKEIEKYI